MRRRTLVRIWISLIALALAAAGCTKSSPKPVQAVAPDGQNEIRAVIGSEGGELHLGSRGAWLEIPKGLLQEEVSLALKQEEPTFDLPGKDFVGKAYRISPRITFAPGAARLFVPIDRPLPGLPDEINLQMYYYGKKQTDGPAGPTVAHTWQPQPLAKFAGFSQDQRFLIFWIYETISDRSTKAPFGLFQAGYDLDR